MTALGEDSRPAKNSRIAARVVEGHALIVIVDQKALHRLNDVGTRVWELCDGRNVGEIADAIMAEFDVDRATALRDVLHFVADLQRVGALELEAA